MSISEFVGGGYGQFCLTEEKSNKVGSYPRESISRESYRIRVYQNTLQASLKSLCFFPPMGRR